MSIIAERLANVRTIQSGATVDLEQSSGSSVRLDAALVAQSPGMLRLRAWKFSRAVFDATLRNDELWLLPDEQRTEAQGEDIVRIAMGIRRAHAMLSPEFYESARVDLARTTPRFLHVVGEVEGESLVCVIDRATLTPQRFESISSPEEGADAKPALVIELKNYRMIGDVAWPHAWAILHPRGRALIRLHEVDLQGEVPPSAFVPPRRALRYP